MKETWYLVTALSKHLEPPGSTPKKYLCTALVVGQVIPVGRAIDGINFATLSSEEAEGLTKSLLRPDDSPVATTLNSVTFAVTRHSVKSTYCAKLTVVAQNVPGAVRLASTRLERVLSAVALGAGEGAYAFDVIRVEDADSPTSLLELPAEGVPSPLGLLRSWDGVRSATDGQAERMARITTLIERDSTLQTAVSQWEAGWRFMSIPMESSLFQLPFLLFFVFVELCASKIAAISRNQLATMNEPAEAKLVDDLESALKRFAGKHGRRVAAVINAGKTLSQMRDFYLDLKLERAASSIGLSQQETVDSKRYGKLRNKVAHGNPGIAVTRGDALGVERLSRVFIVGYVDFVHKN